MFKIVFVDIDGVLVRNTAEKISPEVARAIAKASKKIHISLCTGRNINNDVSSIIKICQLENEYHILESGTRVLGPGLKWEYFKPLDKDLIPKIIDRTRDQRESYGVSQDGQWIRDIKLADQDKPITILSINTENKAQTEKAVELLKKYSDLIDIGVGTHHTLANGNCIHVTQKGANKSYGVKYIQQKLNYSKSVSVGVGDMPMDRIFLDECALILAPENSDESIIKIADFVFPSVADKGFIKALDYLETKNASQ